MFADEMFELLIFGMNSDCGIAEHRLGPRCCNRHEGLRIFRIIGFAFNRIIKIIEMPVRIFRECFCERVWIERRFIATREFERAFFLNLHHFEVGNCRFKMRVPIHETLVFINEIFVIELDENFRDRAHHLIIRRAVLAHGEAFT